MNSLLSFLRTVLLNTKFIVAAAIFASAITADAQTYVLMQGSVADSANANPLLGASVYVEQQSTGAETSANGKYSLRLAAGKHKVALSFVGYKTKIIDVELRADTTVNFTLASENIDLEEAIVSAEKRNANVTRSEMGVERLRMKHVRLIPALMGEVDILKAIRMLPGVQSTSEGSSSFSVRGGSPDQNLILFDEATVYNASHLMGFFSVFNNDAVDDLKLYKGDITPAYGGRLSSLLAVNSHEPSIEKFGGTGGVGTISSRLMLETPAGENLSIFAAGRRTYADLFLALSSDSDLKNTRLYFYDLNGKINWRINSANRISLSAYGGRDRFKNGNMFMDFGNRVMTLRWNRLLSEQTFMNLTLTNGEYNYNIGSTTASLTGDWRAKTFDWSLKSDFTATLGSHTLKFGAAATLYVFHPGNAEAVIENENYVVAIPHSQAICWSAYAGNEQKASERLTLRYGFRLALFQNIGPTRVFTNEYDALGQAVFKEYSSGDFFNSYLSFEPRLGLAYTFDERTSIKANYARSSQFLHLLSTSTSGSPLDIWIPSNPNIKPQSAHQLSAGVFRNFFDDALETSIEGYYKSFDDVIDFKDHPNVFARDVIETELRSGVGKSYGLELMARKNFGRLTGWTSYTWSRTLRKVSAINSGNWYSSPYDRPHNINAVLNYEFSKRVSMGAVWVYSSGQPVTFPVGRYVVGEDFIPIYSGRNNYRMPAYHRMDVSLTLGLDKRKNKRWKNELNISIYNLYGRKNPWMINFHPETDGTQYAEMTYLFWIVPSVTYNFRF